MQPDVTKLWWIFPLVKQSSLCNSLLLKTILPFIIRNNRRDCYLFMRFTCLIIKLYVNLEIMSNCIQKAGIRLKKIKKPIPLLLVVMISIASYDDGTHK